MSRPAFRAASTTFTGVELSDFRAWSKNGAP